MRAHGYGRYTSGCRCEVCRAAKAAYMRARRKVSTPHTTPGGTRYIAPLQRHGTRYGYEERGCRCAACSFTHKRSDRRSSAHTRRAEVLLELVNS